MSMAAMLGNGHRHAAVGLVFEQPFLGQHAEGFRSVLRRFPGSRSCRFRTGAGPGRTHHARFFSRTCSRNAVGEVLLRVGGTRHGLGGLVLRQQV